MKEKKSGRSKSGQNSSGTNNNSAAADRVGASLVSRDLSNEVKLKEMLTELRGTIHTVQSERNSTEGLVQNISRLQEKVSVETRSRHGAAGCGPMRTKLKALYSTAAQQAEAEYDIIKKALDKIQDIKQFREKGVGERPKQVLRRGVLMSLLQQNALSLPLWIGKPAEDPPPLCGAIQADTHYVSRAGDKVAARVRSQDAEENWILAEVVSFTTATNKYDVDDIDAEEGKERHTLSKRRITPLPLWKAHPEANPEALFAKGALVLALYPQTTCFYRALIHTRPTKPTEEYSVLFEDTSYPNGYSPPLNVCQRYVIVCREDKKK